MPAIIQDSVLRELEPGEDYDVALSSPARQFGTNVNTIPLQGAVQMPRLFYGARFANQALPLVEPEAPLVQNLDPDDESGRSFDQKLGRLAGALFHEDDAPAEVVDVKGGLIRLRGPKGDKMVDLYDSLPFNRKTRIHQTPVVRKGDVVKPGQLLARSNYTDASGTLALGTNARIALVPFKGYSMDDATVVSESFAKKLTSEHSDLFHTDLRKGVKGGREHFTSLFPTAFKVDQLDKLDEDGVVKPGQIVQPGDPLMLLTRPKVVSSASSMVGKLSKTVREARSDASMVWEEEVPGEITDVVKTGKGFKVIVRSLRPARPADKIVLRSGNKGVISKILPDDQMPRTSDGRPLDVLLNELGLPSRVNSALQYELLLGKVARKLGKSLVVPSYTKPGEYFYDVVRKHLDSVGLNDTEQIFDPVLNRTLKRPVTVGEGAVLKLHHTASSKTSSRGQGGYDCYDADTEVLTQSGWKKWADVTREDSLATPDIASGRLSYELPLRLVRYDFDGELLSYRSRKVDFAVTENHKFWGIPYRRSAKDPRGQLKARAISAHELSTRSRWKIPTAGFTVSTSDAGIITVPGISDTRKYSEALQVSSVDFYALLGWYLAEGSIEEDGRFVIWQSKSANPEKYAHIQALLTRVVGAAWEFYARGLRCNDKRLGRLFAACGKQCHEKRVPAYLQNCGPLEFEAFLTAFCAGDGYRGIYQKPKRVSQNEVMGLCSSSHGLLSDIQRMLFDHGIGSVLQLAKSVGSKSMMRGRQIETRVDNWALYVHLKETSAELVSDKLKNRDSRYKGSWFKQRYCGEVFCATTRTGWLVVRRNGKVCVSGNSDQQPARGGGDAQQSKRLSGLEISAMLSSGAYANLREAATLRGQRNDEFWRAIRAGQTPKTPGRPFVWDKFRVLLAGAGIQTRDLGKGRIRLGPFTDRDLDEHKALPVEHGEIVDPYTLAPVAGGLFDESLVGGNRWGKVDLPEYLPNPAFEGAIRALLGLKKQELRDLIAGKEPSVS